MKSIRKFNDSNKMKWIIGIHIDKLDSTYGFTINLQRYLAFATLFIENLTLPFTI